MDGTEKLCIALYGLEKVGKYIGGSDAPMLHDAAAEIDKLRLQNDQLQKERDCFKGNYGRVLENNANLLLRVAQTERLNGELVEVARLAYNAFYSHTQPETNVWEADLREAIKELSADTLRVIGEANKPTSEKRVVSTQNGCRPGCLCRKVADPNHGCSCHAETKCECVCGHDWENHEDPGGECVVTTLKDGKVGTYCQCGKFTEKQA